MLLRVVVRTLWVFSVLQNTFGATNSIELVLPPAAAATAQEDGKRIIKKKKRKKFIFAISTRVTDGVCVCVCVRVVAWGDYFICK